MTEIEKLEQELTEYNRQLRKIRKDEKSILGKIERLSRKIDYFKRNKVADKVIRTNPLIKRDVQLVVDYLYENGKSTPVDIIEYINEQIGDGEKRWRRKLENSLWSTSMEPYIMKHGYIEKTKENNRIFFSLSSTYKG